MFLCEPCVELYWRYGQYKDTLGNNFVSNHLRFRNKHDQDRMNRFKHMESLVLSKSLVQEVALFGLPEEDREILETEEALEKKETELESLLGTCTLLGACSLEKSSESSRSKDSSDEGYDSRKNHSLEDDNTDELMTKPIPKGKLIELCISELRKKPLISSYVKCNLKLITTEDIIKNKTKEDIITDDNDKENEPPNEKKVGTPSNLETLSTDIPVPPRKLETPLQKQSLAQRVFTPRRKLEFEVNQ